MSAAVFYAIFLLGIVGLAGYAVWQKNRRLPIEGRREPLHVEPIGARIGLIRVSYPLAELRLYDDLLVVSGLTTWSCPLSELGDIETSSKLLRGDVLHLSDPFNKKEVRLVSRNAETLVAKLRRQLESLDEAAEDDRSDGEAAEDDQSDDNVVVEW